MVLTAISFSKCPALVVQSAGATRLLRE